MLFNSGQFLVFFPIVVLMYFVLPKKIKNIWLLISSYYFYMCWNAKYIVLIFTSTVITWLSGIAMERIKQTDKSLEDKVKLKKMVVAASFITNIGLLGYFKYTNFFLDIISRVFARVNIDLNIPTFDILLPVGISFYTFQALSYTMDVYREDIYAEKNFLQYALFVSFFPQLVAGPIERSKNLLKQLAVPKKFSYDNLRKGLLLMLWGYFLKIVIADRAAVFVDAAFDNLDEYGGWYAIVAIIIFAAQIYCDFYGYSVIAMGASKILGIDLMENFDTPFLQTTISGFWKGWHVSLTSWFRDYLYIPLGGNKKGKVRKDINILIVFTVSGLWHGASLTYVLWGAINGLYQVIADILMPIRKRICTFFELDRKSLGHKIAMILGTDILFLFSLVMFRAKSLTHAMQAYSTIFKANNPWILFDGSLYNLGLNSKNMNLLLFCIFVLLFADICKKKQIKISEVVLKQNMWCRVLFVSVSIVFILIFGIWGPEYDAANFIYFQF